MKITLVSGIYPPDIGGPATFVPQLAQELVNRGHIVTCFSLRNFNQPKKVFNQWSESFIKREQNIFIRFFQTVVSLCYVAKDSDVIFANGLHQEVAIANLFLKKKIIAKIVGDPVWERAINKSATDQSIEDFQHGSIGIFQRAQRKFLTWSLNSFNAIITPGQSLKEMIYSWGVSTNVLYVPNGTEIAILTNNLEKKYDLITVSRLVPWKNIDSLLKALAGTNLKILIVGEGPDKQNLEKLAVRNSININFYGKADPVTVDSLLQQSRVFVLLSSYEGMSFSLLRAMMFGLPVIVSDIPANTEVVTNGKDGLIVDVNNSQSLRSTIAGLLQNPELQYILGVNAKYKISEFYTLSKVLDETIKIIQDNGL